MKFSFRIVVPLLALFWQLQPVRASQPRLLKVNATSMLLSTNGSSLVWSSPQRCAWVDVATLHILSRFSVGDGSRTQVLNLSSDGSLALVKRGTLATVGTLELWKRHGQTAVRKWNWKGTHDVLAAIFVGNQILLYMERTVWTLDLKGVLRNYQQVRLGGEGYGTFSPDGRFLLTEDRLLDLKTGRKILQGLPDYVQFSPSGQFLFGSLVTMLNDREVYVYENRTGRVLSRDETFTPVWAPNDAICGALNAGPIVFYDVRTGQASRFHAPYFPSNGWNTELEDMQFSYDGKVAIVFRRDGKMWVLTQ